MTGPALDDGITQCERCDNLTRYDRLCGSCLADDMGPDDDRDDGEPYDNCHLMPDGQCLLAGTEECDWECGRLR